MSYQRGRQKTVRPKPSPDEDEVVLERPSLFAQQHDADDDDMQRVHILSTLESARRPARGSPSQRQRARKQGGSANGNWQIKALTGLMGAGLLSLLAAFVLLLLDGGAEKSADLTSTQTTVSAGERANRAAPVVAQAADRDNPLAALMTRPGASAANAASPLQQAAVIENGDSGTTAATAFAGETALSMQPAPAGHGHVDPTPTQSVLAMVAPGAGSVAVHSSPSLSILPDKATAQMQPGAAQPAAVKAGLVSSTAVDASLARPTPRLQEAVAAAKRRPRAEKDDDVALLEAVMAHSATRKSGTRPALSVTDELKRCDELSGGAAATCRARVCVQNPTALACHTSP